MEFELYVVARRSRLVEHAIELGVPTDRAPALVDRVLEEQRRAIARADDPDPALREAVREAVVGRPRRTLAAPLAAAVLALLIAAVAIRFATVEPPADPRVPSTYALDVTAASALLTDAGFEVTTRVTEICETADQVVATEPTVGTEVAEGSTIALIVASPPGLSCPGGGGFREEVWAFLRWVRGAGSPPDLADVPSVALVTPTGTSTIRLDRADLVGQVERGELLGELRTVVTAPARTPTGFPQLTVANGDPRLPCGLTPPAGFDTFLSISFQLDTAPAGSDDCALTGYLIPDGGRLATVVLVLPDG